MTTDEAWPPAIDDATVWRPVVVRNGHERGETYAVRPVQLWGRVVEIDRDGRVLCTYCGTVFHTVEQLGHISNGCPTGLIRKVSGRLRDPYGAAPDG